MATIARLGISRVECRARPTNSRAKANWPDKAMPSTTIYQHPELLPKEMRKNVPLLPVPRLKRRRIKTMTPEIEREVELERQEYEYYKTKHMETYMHLTRKVQFWREGFRVENGRDPTAHDMTYRVQRLYILSICLGDKIRAMD